MRKFEERSILSPVKLTTRQEELCRRLDSLNQRTIQGQELSKILIGAIYAIREECRSNPDWVAQSAHSFREILYPFYSGKIKNLKVKEAFKSYGSATSDEETFRQSLGAVYDKITDVAHHQPISTEDYEKLVEDFQDVLLWALDRQIDIHHQIDKFFSENKPKKTG